MHVLLIEFFPPRSRNNVIGKENYGDSVSDRVDDLKNVFSEPKRGLELYISL